MESHTCQSERTKMCQLTQQSESGKTGMIIKDCERIREKRKSSMKLSKSLESGQLPNSSCKIRTGFHRKRLGVREMYSFVVLIIFVLTDGLLEIAHCEQSIDSTNVSDNLENSLHLTAIGSRIPGGTGDVQLNTDKNNINQGATASENSASEGQLTGEKESTNGGDIGGAAPFGLGNDASSTNRNEKQPGLLCPDIYPVSKTSTVRQLLNKPHATMTIYMVKPE